MSERTAPVDEEPPVDGIVDFGVPGMEAVPLNRSDRAKDHAGDRLTRRPTDARTDMPDINVLIHKAITDGEDVGWE